MCEAPEWRPQAPWSPGPTANAAASAAAPDTARAASASPTSPDESRGAALIHAVLSRASEWVQEAATRDEQEALVERLQEAMVRVCRVKTDGNDSLRAQRSEAVSCLFSVQEVVEAWGGEPPPVEHGPPLAELNKITDELNDLRWDALLALLSGELASRPARARRLASSLSSLLVRLDSVEACGRQDVRCRRRAAVARTELLLRQMEPRARAGPSGRRYDVDEDPLLGHHALPEIRGVAAEAEELKLQLLALPMTTAIATGARGAGPDGSASRGGDARGPPADCDEAEEAREDGPDDATRDRRSEAEEEDEEEEEGEEERLLPRAERRLLALMERLDRVESGRNPYVRRGRRRAVLEVQGLLAHLELRRAVAEGRARQVAAPAAAPAASAAAPATEGEGRSSPAAMPAGPLHPAERAILQVLLQLCSLQREALAFVGDKSERGYALLDELLTKQLLSLDAVDTGGWAHGREARRRAVRTAQTILAYLDAKSDDPED